MSKRDNQPDDRILSDFSTDPELAGYSHKTWALAVLFVGLALFVLPRFFPLPVALIIAVGVVVTVGILFSATPPHLSPFEFGRRRITSQTHQQVYVPDGNNARRTSNSRNERNSENETNSDTNTDD